MESLSLATSSSPAHHLTSDPLAPHHFSPTMSEEPQTFLKMEDLHSTPPPSDDLSQHRASTSTTTSQTSPPPIIVNSKPAKKRKSWGQELPEPKTALPPRKRAKTDDEKEQRRIERIKRNRAAAHNSRERKRQETETLAVALARANAELDAYRRLHGPLPSDIVLPEVTLSTTDGTENQGNTPAPSLVESHGSMDSMPSPKSPADLNLNRQDSPVIIKQEPIEPSFALPSPAFTIDAKPAPALDLTQHSAAMLCDLQCQSSSSSSATPSTSWSTALFLYLMSTQLQTFYKTLLLAIWSTSPSRMARLMQASTLRSTSRSMTSSMTPLLSRSMALAQLNAATSLRPALRRSSLTEVVSARVTAAATEQHLTAEPSSCKALEEQGSPDESHESPGENGLL